MKIKYKGREVDFRSPRRPVWRKVVMRLLDKSNLKWTCQAGLCPEALADFEAAIRAPGMILVTGPTGCSATTLYSALDRLINRKRTL
jgi:type II secretory ATPase GspE/PulE/Tfp pilus assembly ATPase PilB-like protein